MKYLIDKNKLSEDKIIYLENFDFEIRKFIGKELQEYPSLAVSPIWEVKDRGTKFLDIKHNADFSKNGSLAIVNKIELYIKSHLIVEFSECSLFLTLNFRQRQVEEPTQQSSKELNEKKSVTKDDGTPTTFLPQKPRYRFEQIILPEETKTRILNDLNTIKYQNLIYDQWGFSEVDSKPKSILNFFGPPGTGKTMCAHAIADLLHKPLLALNYSEIESKYVGDAAKNLKKAFDTATELDAVMFFDEADSFLGKRIENVTHGSDQALNSLRSQMLILLEDFEGVVLFATNLVTNFDKAFESRILDHIKLDLPNREARADIISKMLPTKLPMEHRLSQEELLEASDVIDGFAGREIKGAILTMLLEKAGLNETSPLFTFDDLKSALEKKKSQIEQLKKEESDRRKEKITKKLQERLEEDSAFEEEKEKKKANKQKKRRKH